MKKIGSLQMILGILALFSFCSLLLVLQPAFIPLLDLSTDEASNIGSAIGGIIAPVVGMFSAYLLYEALTAQQEGNKYQQVKGDSDIIFLLLNQLDKEYDTFHLKQNKGGREIHLYGYDALASICHLFKSNCSEINIYNHFKDAQTTNKTMYLVRSYMMVRERVFASKFSAEIEKMFLLKLHFYYVSKFKFPIKHLVDAFGTIDDPVMNEIKEFHRINDVVEY